MIEDMTLDDVPEVLAIERRSFATPWTEENFRHEVGANPVAVNRVLRAEGVVAGYVSAYVVAGELQVNDIAVAPEMRRRGFGRQLLDDVMAIARERGAAFATLEVRPSNAAARALYAARGFVEVGRRPGYYPESGEDALLLERPLGGDR
ncbi:MAG TPA: ribosomal protein S18-alanine N-acetyltransferase [Candidatus Polarisedimenticolaceae bacterium]|nr:ribosomal protein S18-alanine N-acetyltransferase [Candidatus Polarisedimenticolaceae bacterium]